jgi:hypothetical protein
MVFNRLLHPSSSKDIAMKTTKLLIAAAALSAFAMGASAENYQGVLQVQSSASRTAVQAAAHGADPYADGATAGVPAVVAGLSDRAQARAGAIAAARAGNIYADGAGAGPNERFASTLDRAAVRAQAVATAHGIDRLAL